MRYAIYSGTALSPNNHNLLIKSALETHLSRYKVVDETSREPATFLNAGEFRTGQREIIFNVDIAYNPRAWDYIKIIPFGTTPYYYFITAVEQLPNAMLVNHAPAPKTQANLWRLTIEPDYWATYQTDTLTFLQCTLKKTTRTAYLSPTGYPVGYKPLIAPIPAVNPSRRQIVPINGAIHFHIFAQYNTSSGQILVCDNALYFASQIGSEDFKQAIRKFLDVKNIYSTPGLGIFNPTVEISGLWVLPSEYLGGGYSGATISFLRKDGATVITLNQVVAASKNTDLNISSTVGGSALSESENLHNIVEVGTASHLVRVPNIYRVNNPYKFTIRTALTNTDAPVITMEFNGQVIDVTSDFSIATNSGAGATYRDQIITQTALSTIAAGIGIAASAATANPVGVAAGTIGLIGGVASAAYSAQNVKGASANVSNFYYNITYFGSPFGVVISEPANINEIVKISQSIGYECEYIKRRLDILPRAEVGRPDFDYYEMSAGVLQAAIPAFARESIEAKFKEGVRIWYNEQSYYTS